MLTGPEPPISEILSGEWLNHDRQSQGPRRGKQPLILIGSFEQAHSTVMACPADGSSCCLSWLLLSRADGTPTRNQAAHASPLLQTRSFHKSPPHTPRDIPVFSIEKKP